MQPTYKVTFFVNSPVQEASLGCALLQQVILPSYLQQERVYVVLIFLVILPTLENAISLCVIQKNYPFTYTKYNYNHFRTRDAFPLEDDGRVGPYAP